MRDSKEFRERFLRWKNGEKVYDAGRIVGYTGGKEAEYWDAVKDFVAQYEGFKDTTYLDGKGIPTIGYGFTDPTLTKRGKISRSEADKYFIDRLKKEDNILRDTLTNWDQLGTDAKKALISYRYNYPAGFKDTTNFIKYWNAGDYMNAIKEVDAGWNDTANPGLRIRREAEQALLKADPFLSGKVDVATPMKDPAELQLSRIDPISIPYTSSLEFNAPAYSTAVNQPFRTVSADKLVDNSAGWKAMNHFLTLNILNDLAKGYDWKPSKLPPLFPLNGNQWTNSLIGYKGGKDDDYTYEGRTLPEVTVYPTTLTLRTHYPIISNYLPGHSELFGHDNSTGRYFGISKQTNNAGYNFITNNCSDDTRKALEAATGDAIRPFLFTTPGDVQDFFRLQYPNYRERWNNGVRTLNANVSLAEFNKAKEIADSLSVANYKKRHDDNIEKWRLERLKTLSKYIKGKDSLPGYTIGEDGQNWFDEFRENHPTASTVASFLPIVGTAMDVYDAYKDPTAKNIGYAALSAATDLIGGRMVTKLAGEAILRHRLFKKIMKATKKELSNWPYYKNMEPAVAKRYIESSAREQAERAINKMDLPEELLSDLTRFAVPAAVYTPDFVVNANQYQNRNIKYAFGKDDEGGGFLNRAANALIGASVADAPAVATASGWHNEDGQWRLNRTAADEDLGRRLVDISMMSPTNPATAALDQAVGKLKLALNISPTKLGNLIVDKVVKPLGGVYTKALDAATKYQYNNWINADWVERYGIDWAKNMPKSLHPVRKNVSDDVRQSVMNSVVPRLLMQRPVEDAIKIENEIQSALNKGYDEFPEEAYRLAGHENYGGLYNPRKDYVSIKQGSASSVPHEMRHRIDASFPLTDTEEQILNSAYTDDFINMSKLRKYNGIDLKYERVTTNDDARRYLLGDADIRLASIAEQNAYIDKATNEEILEAVANANGYGKTYIKQLLKKYKNVPDSIIKGFRESMKYVGAYAAVAAKKKQLK